MLKQRKGFTLIEVLIVVVIISILSGVALSLLNSGGYRQKARDSQRVSDLRKIQTALELYFGDYRVYPSSASWSVMNQTNYGASLGTYMSAIPSDPMQNGSGSVCSNYTGTNYYYGYITYSSASRYYLTARMETSTANSSPCSNLNAWSTNGCAGAVTGCYGVQNP